MKKLIILALVVMASALTANAAGDKKDKKKKKAQTEQSCCAEMSGACKKEMGGECCMGAKPTLFTERDSVSYATGMAVTNGLMPYLQNQLGLDPMYLEDFKQGFMEAISRGTDPKFVARNAGMQIATQVQKQIMPKAMAEFENTPDSINEKLFLQGFIAGAMNDTTYFDVDKAEELMKNKANEMKTIKNAAVISENTKWLEENRKKPGVITLPSGLQYKVITEGHGAVAQKTDNVTVKYEGKMIDGTVFDSSYTRTPDTTSFRPDQVIKGWTEALCMMPEGSKWELYIPQELGYGERPAGKIKPYSTLIFTVEVVKVEKK